MKKLMAIFSLFLILLLFISHQSIRITIIDTPNGIYQSDRYDIKRTQAQNSIPAAIDFREIFLQTSADTFYQSVSHLSETIGPRPYGSDANIEARNWVLYELAKHLDYGNVMLYGDYQNVIGLHYSKITNPTMTICFTGHFDTVDDSPGADDNASGTALILEIARLLGGYSELAMDLAYLGCNAEELGLLGAFELAPFIKDLIDPQLVINADMILNGNPILFYTYDDLPYESYQYIAELIQAFGYNYGQGYLYLSQIQTNQAWWSRSDHFPFYLKGMPVMLFHETVDTPHYHTGLDTADQSIYNHDHSAELASSVASTVLFLSSRITDPFTNMDFQGILEPGQNRTYLIQGLEGDFFSSKMTSNAISGSLQLKLDGYTDWRSGFDFLALDTGRHLLTIRNTGNIAASYEIRNIFASDSDGDGVVDFLLQDPDGDGLSTLEELSEYNTDPYSTDTDNDSLEDGFEVDMRLDPSSNDTDSDLMDDYYEYIYGLDPRTDDSTVDHDHDGLTNLEEYRLGTRPRASDSDKDGFNDGQEVEAGTDPLDSKDHPEITKSTGFEWYGLLTIMPLIWLYRTRSRKRR